MPGLNSGRNADPGSRSTERLPRPALIAAWVKAYGRPPPKGISTRLLAMAAAYNAQARHFGELKTSIRKALYALAGAEKPAFRPKATAGASLAPGNRLVREWHGRTHVVDVVKNGVLYQGKTYRSLSEVARAITGARWSGPRFFGL